MARLFDIDRNKVVLDPNILAIPSIKKLWDRDKSKDKPEAMREITYIVFMYDFHSPYRDITSKEKESIILKEVFQEQPWTPDDKVKEAVAMYKKLQITPSMRLLESSRNSLDKLSDYFDRINFEDKDGFGKPIYTAQDLVRNVKEVGTIVKSLSNLDKQVRLELEDQSVRGNSEIGYFEDPK